MPKISVVVPVYNVQDYVGECLDSLEAQTYGDIEVICVDDGSTDGSADVVAEHAARDARIRVVRKENGGLSSARNAGMAVAQGDIVMFVDSDDYVATDACARIAAAFEATGAEALVYGAQVVPAEHTTPWYERALCPPAAVFEGSSAELLFSDFATPFAWRTAVSREALGRTGVTFDETLPFGEDLVFQFALYPRLAHVACIPDRLYRYRLDRPGSLMEGRRGDFERLRAHADMMRIIFADWERQGLIRGNSARLLRWSVPYLLRGVEKLTPDQRAQHVSDVRALWRGRFSAADAAEASDDEGLRALVADLVGDGGPEAVRAACDAYAALAQQSGAVPQPEVTDELVCRGDGKLYLRCLVKAPAGFTELECAASVEGRAVPVSAYPSTLTEFGPVQHWTVVLPQLDVASVDVSFKVDGHMLEVPPLQVSYGKAKWLSRLNYRIYPGGCAAIRDIDRKRLLGYYQVDIRQRFDALDGAVWRAVVSWAGDPAAMPAVDVVDGAGNAVPADCMLFEFQPASASSTGAANELYLSIKTPADAGRLVFNAHAADARNAGGIRAGFAVVDAARIAELEADAARRLKSAGDDDAHYRAWLDAHRIADDEARAQAALDFEGMPFLSVFVAGGDPARLDATLDSLRAQTYGRWELLMPAELVARLPEGAHARAVSWGVAASAELADRAQGDYLVVLPCGGMLERDALFEFAQAGAVDSAEDAAPAVLYCDEDVIMPDGAFGSPFLKSKLNVDLLYCGNWLGRCVAFQKQALEGLTPCDSGSFGAWSYDRALRLLEADARFRHVPRVLCHGVEPAFANPNERNLVALGVALQGHFDRRGVRGQVEAGPVAGTLRMRYALPDPEPLVSVIIPNKDHVDLLEPCIRSLVGHSSYRALEILVVENNSAEQETFDFYERIQAECALVKVVRWQGAFNYSKIVNFGAQHATGEYLLFLNNDTELIEADSIGEMVGMLQRPEVGVVGAKLLFRDDLVQHAGAAVGVWGAIAHVNQNRTVRDGGYLNRACLPGNFSAVTGACQMVRASVFSEMGGYDEEFAVGFNDIDFCLRCIDAGYLVAYTPYALLHHYEFSSRGRETADKDKLLRWKREQARFVGLWPEPFVFGDPYTGPNLLKDSLNYGL